MGFASTSSFALAVAAAIIALALGHSDAESVGHRPEGTGAVRGPDQNHSGNSDSREKAKPHASPSPNSGIRDDGAVAPPLSTTVDEAEHTQTAAVAGGKGGLEAGVGTASSNFVLSADASCFNHGAFGFIEGSATCRAAASALGLRDSSPGSITIFGPTSPDAAALPHGCWYETAAARLYLNAGGLDESSDTTRRALCRPAAPTPPPSPGRYVISDEGSCRHTAGYGFIDAPMDCRDAASTLHLHPRDDRISVFGASSREAERYPHGCFLNTSDNGLWFNDGGMQHSRDTTRLSICVMGPPSPPPTNGKYARSGDGRCSVLPAYGEIAGDEECVNAATSLGLHDSSPGGMITMFGPSNPNASRWPRGCFWMPIPSRLYYNKFGRGDVLDEDRQALCKLQPNLRRGDFLEAEYGSCKSHPDYDFVESSRLCLLGAAALGLHDTGPGGIITMFGASNPNASHWPHGCYWMPQENRLFFNSGGRSHSEDVTRRSVCIKRTDPSDAPRNSSYADDDDDWYGGFGCVGEGEGRLPLASNNWKSTAANRGDLAILKERIWWQNHLDVTEMFPNLHSSQCEADSALLRNISGLRFACGGSNADQIELEDCESDILLLKKFMFEGFSTTIHADTMSPVAANAPTTAPPTASSLNTKKKKENKTMTVIAIGLGAAVVTLIIGYISMLFFTKKERKLEREKEQMFKMDMTRSHSLSGIRCKEFDETGACKFGDKCKFNHRSRRPGMGLPKPTLICRKCDRKCLAGAKFCSQCGSDLIEIAPSSPIPTEMDVIAQGFSGGSAYDAQEFNNTSSPIHTTPAGPSDEIDEYGGPRGAYADSLESSSFGHLGSMRKMSFDQPDPGLGTTRNAGYFDLSNTSAPAGNSMAFDLDLDAVQTEGANEAGVGISTYSGDF